MNIKKHIKKIINSSVLDNKYKIQMMFMIIILKKKKK